MKIVYVPLSEDYINKILDDMSALQASEGQYLRGPHCSDEEKPDLAISVADREMVMSKLRAALPVQQR
jgi:hypothetical protein